jgi:hypothetical protein
MARPTDWHVLDMGSDPTPGDPWRIKNIGGKMRTLGDDAEHAARDVRGLVGDHAAMNWIGAAGDAFRENIGKFPGQLDKVATSHHMCADALIAYGDTLDGAQSQADRALTQARPLFDQVQSLRSQLATANTSNTSTNKSYTTLTGGSTAPDATALSAAVKAKTDSQHAVDSLNSQLSGPEAQLAALKTLAHQAADLRNSAEDTAKSKINAATDAGIPPDSFWHKLGDLCATLWHGLVIIAKIVSFVGALVLLVVGGPLWLIIAVVVAGLIILADTLYKYSQGKASLLDVGLAVLSCIPMTKGLTTLADLKTAFQFGRFAGEGSVFAGLLGAGGHLLLSGGNAFKALLLAPKALWDGRAAIPSLLKALPYTALGKLTTQANELRFAVPGSLYGLAAGFHDGSGFFGSIRGGFGGLADGWGEGVNLARMSPAQMARDWQGTNPFIGIDRWHNDTATAGSWFESGHPGLSGYAVPGGTMGALGDDASRISQGTQVAPGDIGGPILHNYRPEGIMFQTNQDISMASAKAMANPQFGAGGLDQHFFPHFADDVAAGRIHFSAPDGTTLPATVKNGWVSVTTGPGQVISLNNLDLAAGSGAHLRSTVQNTVGAATHLTYGGMGIGTAYNSISGLTSAGTYR